MLISTLSCNKDGCSLIYARYSSGFTNENYIYLDTHMYRQNNFILLSITEHGKG